MKTDAYQFVIWGYRDTYHTSAHEHSSMFRALQYLGREVRWIDEDDGGDFEKTIFISINSAVENAPLRKDALYVIHNFGGSAAERFKDFNVLNFGVKTNDDGQDVSDRSTTMYWATDLLPHEVQANKAIAKTLNFDSRVIHWVGSVWRGEQGNRDEIFAFRETAQANGISFSFHGGGERVSDAENARLIRDSYFAPTIVGGYQRKVGYIPTRIFKNISYGTFGATNSEAVNRLFGDKLICNPDVRQLFLDAKSGLSKVSIDSLYDLMDEVAAKHTYLNRIDHLLSKAEKLL